MAIEWPSNLFSHPINLYSMSTAYWWYGKDKCAIVDMDEVNKKFLIQPSSYTGRSPLLDKIPCDFFKRS